MGFLLPVACVACSRPGAWVCGACLAELPGAPAALDMVAPVVITSSTISTAPQPGGSRPARGTKRGPVTRALRLAPVCAVPGNR